MLDLDWTEWAMLVPICIASAIGAVAFLAPGMLASRRDGRIRSQLGSDEAAWIYDGSLISDWVCGPDSGIDRDNIPTDWNDLTDLLGTRFPGFPSNPAMIKDTGKLVLRPPSPADYASLTIESLGQHVRITLENGGYQSNRLAPLGESYENYKEAIDHAPTPIWRLSSEGRVTWSNASYDALRKRVPKLEDPGDPVFPVLNADLNRERTRRLPVVTENSGIKNWYDVSLVPRPDGPLCYAIDVAAVVEAESAQRNFVQTLAKTFAQLSIGLAIFDRNRQLALFNPALIDLTSLPADFLSGRPNLLTFFDRLRDQRIMPEPKNYNSWRHQMADLVAAASDGRYQETWTLASGSVYSVNGRPHPDGAIAFLFEDITAEISLTRRFRTDLEMGQTVLDNLDQAIAVFSSDGSLTMSNAAYCKLWSVDPDKSFAQVSIVDATRNWQDKCKATPVWGEIRDFVAQRDDRGEWTSEVLLRDNGAISCRVLPIHSGATMIVFEHARPPSSLSVISGRKVSSKP